jgi:hypothetical protein
MANTIPNLDAMHKDELMDFWMRYQNRQKRADAAALIGDRRPGYTVIAGSLGGYASNKAAAISCRLSGDIQGAMVYESICDGIYDRLPADLRW